MANMPSVNKSRLSLLLDNEIIVALDKKAEDDKTSRNSVANYLLGDRLEGVIKNFSKEDKQKLEQMRKQNWEARYGK